MNIEEYVDLGLPSGKKWAKCNLGAEKETDCGLYFQWGDIEGRTAEEIKNKPCNWETTKFNSGSKGYDKETFSGLKGEVCPNGVLSYRHDAAYRASKGKAHMPTKEDFTELYENTIVSCETDFNGSGINGRKFTSKKNPTKYIFIPASGFASNKSMDGVNTIGFLWSSSLCDSHLYCAWVSHFYSCYLGVNYGFRYIGRSIRGIID